MNARSFMKRNVYLVLAIITLITCWEYNSSNAALAQGTIPEESIRLRILAHSDSPRDQWIKRKIKDQIVIHMREWAQDPQSITEARIEVKQHLPAFEQLIGDVLQKYGFQYNYSVELNIVDFPMKVYGSHVYPAGDYEALRVVLGRGQGENWWCVLFPPLCFVDLGVKLTPEEAKKIDMGNMDGSNSQDIDSEFIQEDTEVRFFLWDSAKQFGGFFKGLFA